MELVKNSKLIINGQEITPGIPKIESNELGIRKGEPLTNMVTAVINIINGKKINCYISQEDAEYLKNYIKGKNEC